MNIGNMQAVMPMGTGTAGATLVSNGGQASAAGQEQGIFSLQLGLAVGAFTNMPEVEFPGLSEEDASALEDLMAMLQQLLGANQQMLLPQEQQISVGDGQAEEAADGKLPIITLTTNEGKQTLLQALTAQGMSSEDANKLTDLLQKLPAMTPDQAKGDYQKLLETVQKTLGQMGISLQKDGALEEQQSVLVTPQLKKQSMPATANRVEVSNQIPTQMQPVRVHHALSQYGQEAGIQVKSFQATMQEAITPVAVNQETVDGDADATAQLHVESISATPVQKQSATTPEMRSFPVRAEQMPQQVTDVFVRQLKVGTLQGVTEAKLILYPQELGKVDVRISSHNGVITAHFIAESKHGKDMLDQQMAQLRTAFAQQGIQVDKLEVSQQNNNSTFSFDQDKGNGGQQAREQSQDQGAQSEQSEASFDSVLDGERESSKRLGASRVNLNA
ncbi:flagellar hook-length control protein FliK [Brevibacillus laterosporus]|uniref:flagellar hook-length control protein FliK n=1 Tax=Brevibacillus laterosporus TaxID=1465 RepID=UPI00264D36F4|nr:flagellar hook-length control protein FliK [Brevibacillus laterosporus]MDN9010276.1 flagellar hook-length control protein FliK [Brevibacillus laterosporus]MDO0941163.1 flagellar hook-length control protein FliK [Brevibacillus laterosporus]